MQRVYLFLGASMIKNEPIQELSSPEVAGSVWKQVVSIADKYYQPGKFTTFAAYEWTSTPDNRNLHRNIIFKDSKKVPDVPFSSLDSDHPEDLWNWMDTQRKAGNELLAISHNANLSDGIMFPLEVDSKGRPIDAAWAQERVNNEPLTEIHQLKGTSETTSTAFSQRRVRRLRVTELPFGRGGTDSQNPRQLYPRGLAERPGDARQPRVQPVQDGSRGRQRLAQHGFRLQPERLFRRPRAPGCHARGPLERQERAWAEYGSAQHCRPGRGVGGREYARGDFRRHAAQGDLRHQRRAHQGAALRRLGFPS